MTRDAELNAIRKIMRELADCTPAERGWIRDFLVGATFDAARSAATVAKTLDALPQQIRERVWNYVHARLDDGLGFDEPAHAPSPAPTPPSPGPTSPSAAPASSVVRRSDGSSREL